MPTNVTYHGPGDLPESLPVFPLSGALLLRAGKCRSTFSSRDTSPWSMTRLRSGCVSSA